MFNIVDMLPIILVVLCLSIRSPVKYPILWVVFYFFLFINVLTALNYSLNLKEWSKDSSVSILVNDNLQFKLHFWRYKCNVYVFSLTCMPSLIQQSQQNTEISCRNARVLLNHTSSSQKIEVLSIQLVFHTPTFVVECVWKASKKLTTLTEKVESHVERH